VAVGTSGVVYPAAGFLDRARERGVPTFVQSLEPPENVHSTDTFVPGRAAVALPPLLAELAREWKLRA
jgi:NAD-dependent deacetylase